LNEHAARANLRRLRETEEEIARLDAALESDRLLRFDYVSRLTIRNP